MREKSIGVMSVVSTVPKSFTEVARLDYIHFLKVYFFHQRERERQYSQQGLDTTIHPSLSQPWIMGIHACCAQGGLQI